MADYFDPNNPYNAPGQAPIPAAAPPGSDNNVSYIPRRQQFAAMGDPGYFQLGAGGTADTTIDPSLAQPRPYRGPLGALIPEGAANFLGNVADKVGGMVKGLGSNLNLSTFLPFGLDRNPPPDHFNPIAAIPDDFQPPPPFAPGDLPSTPPAVAAVPPDGLTDAQRNNAPFHADYLRMQDQQRVDDATAAAQQQAGIKDARLSQNAYDARIVAEKAAREADVANFENGISAGVGRGTARSRGIAADRADAARGVAQKNLEGAQAAYATGAPLDYLGNVVKGQGVVNAGAQARTSAALGQQNLQKGASELDRQRQSASLLQRMTTTQDPKERAALQSSYLVSLGKDPARYTVEHSNGPPVPDQFGNLHPGAQYVHVVDKVTGEVQSVKNDSQEAPANGGYASVDKAHEAAKQSIAAGMSKADANARLKKAGLPELP